MFRSPPRLALGFLALLTPLALPAAELRGPDGAIRVNVELHDGALSYTVAHRDRVFIAPSPLGLEANIGSFAKGLVADGESTTSIDERYTLPHGKTREVHYRANELTSRYKNAQGDALEVIFRVSDRDVAFAYRLSSPKKTRAIIQREATGFRFPKEATTFLTHQVRGGVGWMATKPSYEEAYVLDAPVGAPSPEKLGFTFPALFRLGDSGWALVSETGVNGRYVGSRLGEPAADGLYPLAFPQASENGGVGDATVAAALPLTTPWRTITVGDTLAPVVESTVATDVVKPMYPASHDYSAGRATWSWLLWQDESMNEADQRVFIDLAAAMGYEYILVDALWDKNLGREKLAQLVAEARAKNVGVLLWYNSNGHWNDAPQGPKHRMDTVAARREEMAWLQSIGVKGLKVDFFGGDKQATMQLYEDILTDADEHGLALNFHGATLPRGWERMYPNFMTSEAVTASENLVFSQGFADKEAFNSTVFPLIRNPIGAMDYGPMVLSKRFHRDQTKGTVRRTTDAFQLATTILFQSPLQHFGLVPDNLKEQPAFVIDFLKTVPAAWDETRFVSGYPGDHVALARRAGERWYVAASHAGKERRELALSLPWLKGAELTLIHDRADGDLAAEKSTVRVGADGLVRVTLAPGGGAVLVR